MERDDEGHPQIAEKGMGPDGKPVYSHNRLFIQFLAYGRCGEESPHMEHLSSSGVQGALYRDINDPAGIGLAIAHQDPEYFVTTLREVLQHDVFTRLEAKPEYTMLGRSYSIGYEQNLEHVLVNRPLERITNPEWPWVIWYPLRRKGSFEKLSTKEQREVLMEHGTIGNAFGEADYARDIRLACHGLDKNDNDFVNGLIGANLSPLSAIVQTMRKTQQTSTHLEQLGPFFAGKAVWQSKASS